MLKKVGVIFFFIAVAAFQTAIAPIIAIFGVKPDFLLIMIILWGITFGQREGAFVGFFSGFLEDILSASFYIHTLVNTLCGFFAALIRGSFAFSASATSVLAVSSLTIINYLLKIISFYFFFGRQLPSIYSIFAVIFFSVIYNSVLTVLLLPWTERIFKLFAQDDTSSFGEYTLYRM